MYDSPKTVIIQKYGEIDAWWFTQLIAFVGKIMDDGISSVSKL